MSCQRSLSTSSLNRCPEKQNYATYISYFVMRSASNFLAPGRGWWWWSTGTLPLDPDTQSSIISRSTLIISSQLWTFSSYQGGNIWVKVEGIVPGCPWEKNRLFILVVLLSTSLNLWTMVKNILWKLRPLDREGEKIFFLIFTLPLLVAWF